MMIGSLKNNNNINNKLLLNNSSTISELIGGVTWLLSIYLKLTYNM